MFWSLAAGIWLSAASGLLAQGGPSTLQFSFSNPGARSLGLGGAFVALADDATAAFANPAGLIQLTRPEVSLEGRYWEYSTPYAVGGRTSGEATGIGLDGPIRGAVSEFDTSAVSFLSFVYPRDKWTVAFSYHRSAKFEIQTATQGLFTDRTEDDPQPTCIAGTAVCRYPDVERRTEIDVDTATLSFAYRVTEKLSLGIGLSYQRGELTSASDFFGITQETLPLGFFGPNAYVPEALYGIEDLTFDDTDLNLSAGFLWFLSPQWSLGGAFRPGGDFGGQGAVISGPTWQPPLDPGTVVLLDTSLNVKVPDVYSLGLAYRSQGGAWTTSLEWDRVQYSQILESLGDSSLITAENVRLDDADELRLGVEYAFLDWSPLVAVRGGVWRNPDHSIRSIENDPLEQVLLPKGEDDVHFSLGTGVAFDSFQLDLAVDLSDLVDTAALSADLPILSESETQAEPLPVEHGLNHPLAGRRRPRRRSPRPRGRRSTPGHPLHSPPPRYAGWPG